MKKQVIAVAVLTCASMPSLASNFYLLADAGQSEYEVDVEGTTASKNENVISIGGGYNFNDNFAVELTYRDFGEMTEEYRDNFDGYSYVEKYTTSANAMQLSLVGSFPLGEAAKLYGRVGMADLEIEADYYENFDGDTYSESGSRSKNKAVFGFGLSYSFTPSFALRGEYSQYAEWDIITISTATIGLTYQF